MELEILKQISSIITEKWESGNDIILAENCGHIETIIKKGLKTLNIGQKCCSHCHCNTTDNGCIQSRCILHCLQFLGRLNKFITETDLKHLNDTVRTNVLSIAHTKYANIFLKFIVDIGLTRHFDFQLTVQTVPSRTKNSCYFFDLHEATMLLLTTLDCEEMKLILLPRYLLQILGALIQLSYSPLSRKYLQKPERHKCLGILTEIITKHSHLAAVVRCLLSLQSSSSRTSPPWLNNTCGNLLSKCLLLPSGVFAVISSMTASFDAGVSDWKKADIISTILSTLPSTSKSVEKYFEVICPQLIKLLQAEVGRSEKQILSQIVSATVLDINHKYPEMAEKFIFNSILLPIHCKCIKETHLGKEISDSSLEKCVENLHLLLATFKHKYREKSIIKYLLPYFKIFFQVYTHTQNSINHVVTLVIELIQKSLQTLKPSVASQYLLQACGCIKTKQTSQFSLKLNVKAAFNETGELILDEFELDGSVEQVIENQDLKVQAINKLLQTNKEYLPHVFLSLIQNLANFDEAGNDVSHSLLSPEEKASSHLLEDESHLITFALIMSLCENNEPSDLVINVIQICGFVKMIFQQSVDGVKPAEKKNDNLESLKSCLAILALCLLNELSTEEYAAMQDMVPLLQKISKSPLLTQSDKDTASDLAIAISTRGACYNQELFSNSFKNQKKSFDKLQQQDSKKNNEKPDSKPKKILIEEIPDVFKPIEKQESGCSKVLNSKSEMSKKNSYKDSLPKEDITLQSIEDALDSIHDPNPPIRAAAFRYLSLAFKQKSQNLNEKIETLFDVFIEKLENEQDSFVYLSIVQSIVDLINFSPSIVKENSKTKSYVTGLISTYTTLLLVKDEKCEIKCLKIGEVIIRIIKIMGDLAPFHGKKLVPCLFIGTKDSRPLIRASCLSSLSDLIPMIKHDISTFEQELCNCVCGTINSDDDVTVRRAAVHLIRNVVENLGSAILEVLPNTIKSYYIVLKKVYQQDSDSAIQLHAQLTLEALDTIMRDLIFKGKNSKSFEKKIVILPT